MQDYFHPGEENEKMLQDIWRKEVVTLDECKM